MNISNVSKSASNNWIASGIRRRLFGLIPDITVKKEEPVYRIGRIISRPDVGRAVMGATAILTQPFIDYYNPKVDDDTAKVSTCRTIGKIIAGTTVGCAVRSMCYYGIQALTNTDPNASKWQKLLLPPKSVVNLMNKKHGNWIKNYNSTLATLIGLGVMLFTNVMFDVPLTNFITKKLLPVIGIKSEKKPAATEPAIDNKVTEKREAKEVILERFSNGNKWRAAK